MNSQTTRAALPILCNMLASQCGVEMVWGQYTHASVEGKKVFMPDLPLEGEELARWALGYTGQQAGRIKYSTPIETTESSVMDIVNILEYPRVESLMCRELPGVRYWLDDLTEAMLEDGMLGRIDPEEDLPAQVRKWLMYKSGAQVMQYDCLEQLAIQQDKLLSKVFDAKTMVGLNQCLSDAMSAGSTDEVHDVAKRVAAILGEAEPPEPPDQGGDHPDETGYGQGAGSGNDGGEGDDPGTPEQVQSLQQQIGLMLDPDKWGNEPTDKGQMIAARLDQEVRDGSGSGAGSSVVRFPAEAVGGVPADASALIQEVRAASVAVRSKLDDLLEDYVSSARTVSRSGSRLRRDAAVRMLRGNLKVFERVTEGRDIDCAVVLVCDKSTSMKDLGRLDAAKRAAVALSLAFDGVDGVSTAVTAFPHKGSGADDGVVVLQDFGESVREGASRIAGIAAEGSTPMANALLHAHQMLLEQNVARRIVLVLGDGKPDGGSEPTKAVIRVGQSAGIEHLGVGIGLSLDHLIPASIQIDGVNDLPRLIVNLVRDALVIEVDDQLAA